MKKDLFKKAMAFSLSTVMTVGMAGVVSARVADGTNVATGTWKSFSICTREDEATLKPGQVCWEDALKKVEVKDEKTGKLLRYQTKGQDYATEGKLADGATSSNFVMNVVNSGWDGQYDNNGNLVDDNPWGMTITMENVPVEAGRNYTLSFNIKSTLKAVDKKTKKVTSTKHIIFKAYEPGNGDPALDLVNRSNAITAEGYMNLDSTSTEATNVTATISIPEDYGVGKVGFKFALGALLKSYPEEIGMSGDVTVSDFKLTADKQYAVTYKNGSKTVATKYVNAGSTAKTFAAKKKGYTLAGYKLNGSNYNFSSPVNSDITLVAKWTKTKNNKAAKITSVKTNKAKKAVVNLKKVKSVKGYAVQYSTNAKFKKAKTKTSSKNKITISKLKSGSVVYLRAKTYVKDSKGYKVYNKKWSAKKVVVIK